MTRFRALAIAVALLDAAIGGLAAAASPEPLSVEAFLRDRGIDLAGRRGLGEATAWGDEQERTAIRVLARLAAPSELEARWRQEARDVGPGPQTVDDQLVRARGRATFVAPWKLPPDLARLAARPQFDLVRIVVAAGGDAGGVVVDALVPQAPAAWPRWRPIDEPAAVVGLPLSTVVAPRPAPPADATAWPQAAAGLLVAATRVSWQPPTPLGDLGMDYALFDTVVDGKRLEPGDTDAFYALLAAVGRQAATPRPDGPTDLLPIIDPARKWFATNRGAPVTIVGTARRATRIAIDDAARRAEVGGDHYWELFVFVDTPLLEINGRLQDTYPVVCCVRDVPTGMPTGDRVSERVTVEGFALKRYAYPLADVAISSSQGDRELKGGRMETALVLGNRAVWTPAASPATASRLLSWIFFGLAGIVAAALVLGLWAVSRDASRRERRARAELPDTIRLPDGRD
jgi:hypothetical protein